MIESPVPTTPARRLATVETITHIAPIAGADAIVRARIRGWDVVVKLDEFAPGDACVYFEVDSLLDVNDPRFAFLAPRGVRTDSEGVSGHVLKTARLRGQYSQGLALPLSQFPELTDARPGDDVTEALHVIKWDPPIPEELAGNVRGPLPSWISKTDEPRIQNSPALLTTDLDDWIATEKIDGQSVTYYVDPAADTRGAGTRQWDFLEDRTRGPWRLAHEMGIHDLLAQEFPGQQAAVQGEMFGPGIRKNPLGRKTTEFAAFNLRVGATDVPRSQWPAWLLKMAVPVIEHLTFPTSVEQAVADVETLKSLVSPGRAAEGVVWRSAESAFAHCADGQIVRASVKVISNKYLLKHDV